ncbi:MAG TPA: ElyC/SanA/YdcF family protein, partial [Thermoanaerobaculia bacterium]|nr:ElyC/SanA/YdcF family protein [Thermoanaerobaculia bacterium]
MSENPAPPPGLRAPSPRRGRRVLRWAVTLLAVGGLTAYLPWLWVLRQSDGHVHRLADAPSADVTLVLGAGLTPSGRPSPYLAARLDVAKALLDAGKTQVILVSGDNRTEDYDEPTAMRDYLVGQGVPAWRIVLDFAGRDTYDSCARAQRIFGVDQLLVVSQGYHVPRAVATCRALGLDAEAVGDWSVEPLSNGAT